MPDLGGADDVGRTVIVRIADGPVRGVARDGVSRFLGIPYAAAPVGPRRFAAPARPLTWSTVRDATRSGPTAPQAPRETPGVDLSPFTGKGWRRGNDYLTVNVWTPDPGAGGLPVLVFVHGGAFLAGAGSAPGYDGTRLAQHGLVVVTINYRLGIEGFLPLSGGATNIGLRDQVAALTWVREHVANFGGDPATVTVMGQSSGGVSVACLLASPVAYELFERAIIQSGHGEMVRHLDAGVQLAEAIAADIDVAPTADAFRGLSPEDLVRAQSRVMDRGGVRDADGWDRTYGVTAFTPLVGDDLLPEAPHLAIARRRGIDLMIGSCRDEMAVYLVPSGAAEALDEDAATAHLAHVCPHPEAVLRASGMGEEGTSPGEALVSAWSDVALRAPIRRLSAVRPDETFAFEFAWPSPLCNGRVGACHGIELPFVFGTLDQTVGPRGLTGPAPPPELADAVQAAWVSFATTGDPGWPHYGRARHLMLFDRTSRVVADPFSQARVDLGAPTASASKGSDRVG